MAKTKISQYDATAANNTDINSINIAEGMAPSDVNNAIRELMAELKNFQTGASGDNLTVGGTLAVTGTSSFTGAISAAGGVSGNVTGNVTGTASTATNIAGGLANQIVYQTGAGTTAFLAAPTVTNTAIVWNGTSIAWGTSAASGVVANGAMFQNVQTIPSSYSITSGTSAISAGPMTLSAGVTITVPAGSKWVIL